MPYKYNWTLILNDNGNEEIVHQFENGTEKMFGVVADAENSGKLVKMYLVGDDGDVSVDFRTGLFYIGEREIDPAPELTRRNYNYRVIYYRRKVGQAGEGIPYTEKIAKFLLGWQVTIDNVNYQRIMFLDAETGQIEIKEKR